MISGVWRDVAGYEGRYQVDIDGNVRRIRKRAKPKVLRPYTHKGRGSREYVKLIGLDGRAREMAVTSIVLAAWHIRKPAGVVAYHKNGDTSDHNANNIGFISPVELGRRTGAKAKRRPVRKIDEMGEAVAFYPSARAAGIADYVSSQTVMDRCNGKIQKPFALSGYSYEWDDVEGAECL